MSSNSCITLEIINKYRNKNWCWSTLLYNKNITSKFIKDNIDQFYNWSDILSKSFAIDFLIDESIKNISNLWYYTSMTELSKNKTIPFDLIIKYNKLNWCWCEISKRNDITFEMYINNNSYPWNIIALLGNSNFTYEKIKDYPQDNLYWLLLSYNGPDNIIKNNLNNCNLEYKLIVKNHNILNDTIIQILDIAKVNDKVNKIIFNEYNICNILENKNISQETREMIYKNIVDMNNNMTQVYINCISTYMSFDYICINKHIYWNWSLISMRKDLTWSFVEEHSNQAWYWYLILSTKEGLSWKFILDHINKDWNWSILSTREDLTWNIILEHNNKPWSVEAILNNKSLYNYPGIDIDKKEYLIYEKIYNYVK